MDTVSHNRFRWIGWICTSFFSALIAVPIGYGIAVCVALLTSIVLSFLWIIGALFGIIIGGVLGGMATGAIIAWAQNLSFAYSLPLRDNWIRLSVIGWGLAGASGVFGFIRFFQQELSPLLMIVLFGTLLSIGIQSTARLNKEYLHTWLFLSGGCAVMIGGLLGAIALGATTQRGAKETLGIAFGTREALTEVKGGPFFSLHDQIFFFVTKRDTLEVTRWEIWTSNGAPEGTKLVGTGYTGWNEPWISNLVHLGSSVAFIANGTEAKTDSQSWKNGPGIWTTDGSQSGTRKVTPPDPLPNSVTVSGSDLFFYGSAGDPQACILWKSDGTPSGMHKVRSFQHHCPFQLTTFKNKLFFQLDDPDLTNPACGVWYSDGTEEGTQPLKSFGLSETSCIQGLIPLKDRLLILATTMHGAELWSSDGTTAGTIQVTSLENSFQNTIQYTIDHAFFTLAENDTGEGCALWATDGTVANTVQISDMCLNLGQSISVNNTLLFMTQAPNNTYDLWRSDGTVAGTIRIHTGFTSGNEGYSPMFMLTDGGKAYLRIYGKEGCELWKSDGTSEGTFVLYKGCPTQVGATDGTVYFITQQNEREIALWRSDGTPAGTVQITIVQ